MNKFENDHFENKLTPNKAHFDKWATLKSITSKISSFRENLTSINKLLRNLSLRKLDYFEKTLTSKNE